MAILQYDEASLTPHFRERARARAQWRQLNVSCLHCRIMKAYSYGILKKLTQRRKGAKKPSIQNTPHCLGNGVLYTFFAPLRLCVYFF